MEHPGRVFGELFFYALVIAGIIWLVVHLVRRNRAPQTNQVRWNHAMRICNVDSGCRLGQVTAIAQADPQRGSLAWVTWYAASQPQSTWFDRVFPPVGSWVFVSGVTAPDGRTFHVTAVHDVIV